MLILPAELKIMLMGAGCDQAAAACAYRQMQHGCSWVDASYDGDLIIAEPLFRQRDTDKEKGLQKEGAALVRWVSNVHWFPHIAAFPQPRPLVFIPLETQGQGELMHPSLLVQHGDEISPGCTPWTTGVSQTHDSWSSHTPQVSSSFTCLALLN